MTFSLVSAFARLRALTLASFALSAACSQAAEGPAGVNGATRNGPSGEVTGSIRCTYAYRQSNEVMEGQTGDEPAFQLQERVLTVAADEDASETLGQLTLSIGYHTFGTEGDTASLAITAAGARLLSVLYQLPSGLPQNQFSGGHGFTGLLYFTHPTAGGDYQAFCEAVR